MGDLFMALKFSIRHRCYEMLALILQLNRLNDPELETVPKKMVLYSNASIYDL